MIATMRRFPALVLALTIALLASGCFTTRYTIPPEHARDSYDVIGSFEEQRKASWAILGLVPIREAEVEQLIADAVEREGGDAATNVVVTAQYDGGDVLISLIVGGLFNTRSYRVTGDVVRFRTPVSDASPIIGPIRYEEVNGR